MLNMRTSAVAQKFSALSMLVLLASGCATVHAPDQGDLMAEVSEAVGTVTVEGYEIERIACDIPFPNGTEYVHTLRPWPAIEESCWQFQARDIDHAVAGFASAAWAATPEARLLPPGCFNLGGSLSLVHLNCRSYILADDGTMLGMMFSIEYEQDVISALTAQINETGGVNAATLADFPAPYVSVVVSVLAR